MTLFFYYSISRISFFSCLSLSLLLHPFHDYDLNVDRARVFIEFSILLRVLTRTYTRALRDNAAFPLQYLPSMKDKRKQGDLADTRDMLTREKIDPVCLRGNA